MTVDVLSRLRAGLQDRYTIERVLGRGGMATVYLARDLKHGRQVAIKVFSPELASSIGAERFLLEIKTTAQLTHPHILSLHDSGEVDGLLYYIMPYVSGETLRDLLNREKQLPIADAVRIALQIADALAYAHAHGVVHRDIKPGNLLLPHRGHVWVADFGLAKALHSAASSDLTSTGLIVGSPIYMSPEQAAGDKTVGAATDIYSLACVLYEMLTGVPPFQGQTVQALLVRHLTEMPRSLRSSRPEVPDSVDAAVLKALGKDPDKRYDRAEDFAKALSRQRAEPNLPATPGAANLGQFVSRTCNRWKQVNAFDACFRASSQTHVGRPQFYIVHGDEGEGHDSLVERLIATRISRFAAEIGGEERGTVLELRIPWPDEDDLGLRQRDLTISLFREVAPTYMGNELSATALARLSAASRCPITVIQHDLRAACWDATTEDLIRWYVNSFWGALQPSTSPQLFLVFLKIVYAPPPSGLRRLQWLLRGHADKQAIQNRLERTLRLDAICAAQMLPELVSVTVEDVKNWFGQNGIYDSERRRLELAERIFPTAGAKRMAEVEHALEQIHREFVREVSTRQWSGAW